MRTALTPFLDVLLAYGVLFLLSFWREKKFVGVLEAPIHIFIVYRIFFSSFAMARSSLGFLCFVSVILALSVSGRLATKRILPFLFLIPLGILGLSRILPSVPMGDFALYLGSSAPQVFAATGLLSEKAIPGLSYLAFRWIRAMVDLRKMETRPQIGPFLSYCFFAPWYASGPISNFNDFIEGTENRWRRTPKIYGTALLRIIWGTTKFYALSSIVYQLTFTRLLMDHVEWSWGLALTAAVAYPTYLFLNFSGFTDMMIGLSALLGHRSTENFDRPYLATSIKQFWRSWHISLTSLLKDFLYVPIVTKLNAWGVTQRRITYPVGTTFVFFIMALWHGSEWNFMVFSGLQVMALVLEDRFWPLQKADWPWIKRGTLWLFLALSFFFFENSPDQLNQIKTVLLSSKS